MSNQRGWKPTLRYSPVNGIIVDWGIGNEPFSMCCMPTPKCEEPSPTPDPDPDCPCGENEIVEPVDTYDWYRWVPEIIAGIDDASEDLAATYARRAAIEFAQKARVLQRRVVVRLQPGIHTYPLFPFEDESVQGVMAIDSASGACNCECHSGGVDLGEVSVNIARQELHIRPHAGSCGCHTQRSGPDKILVTVWSAPTEESCKHDVYLYTQYRREIAMGARAAMIEDVYAVGRYRTARGYANFRGDSLMFSRADKARAEFERAMRKARVEAATQNALDTHQPGSLFATGCCAIGRA